MHVMGLWQPLLPMLPECRPAAAASNFPAGAHLLSGNRWSVSANCSSQLEAAGQRDNAAVRLEMMQASERELCAS